MNRKVGCGWNTPMLCNSQLVLAPWQLFALIIVWETSLANSKPQDQGSATESFLQLCANLSTPNLTPNLHSVHFAKTSGYGKGEGYGPGYITKNAREIEEVKM